MNDSYAHAYYGAGLANASSNYHANKMRANADFASAGITSRATQNAAQMMSKATLGGAGLQAASHLGSGLLGSVFSYLGVKEMAKTQREMPDLQANAAVKTLQGHLATASSVGVHPGLAFGLGSAPRTQIFSAGSARTTRGGHFSTGNYSGGKAEWDLGHGAW